MYHQHRRRIPTWSAALTALAAVLALVAPLSAPGTSPQVSLATWDIELREAPVDLQGAAEAVLPSVVQIDTQVDYQGIVGNGTGFVLSPGGEVLTAFHVVQGANSITARNVGTGQTFTADLVGFDRHNDIAVLQLRGAGGLPSAPIAGSPVGVGDPVVAIGNANGTRNAPDRDPGTVTGLNRSITAEDATTGSTNRLTGLIEVSADIRPGDSGGPLVNGLGQVVGLTSAATIDYKMETTGEGFAIPIAKAMGIANQIRARSPSPSVHIGPPTILGVGVLTAEQRRGVEGVIVRDVLIGGPAESAGLRGGDVITVLDGTRVNSATELVDVLDRRYPGDVIDITYLDSSGQQRTSKATLAAG